jgi:3-dehydroquinate dehydratase-2
MLHITIINGPNLNLVGKREPELYGHIDLATYLTALNDSFDDVHLSIYQSNCEGNLIDAIHAHGFSSQGLIINPGGYSHTSIAIADAIRSVTAPCVEVHLTNIFNREPYRHTSFTAAACQGSISGFGLDSYRLALLWFRHRAGI